MSVKGDKKSMSTVADKGAKKGRKPKDPNAPPKVKKLDVYGILFGPNKNGTYMRVQTKGLRDGTYLARVLRSQGNGRGIPREAGMTTKHTDFDSAKAAAEQLTSGLQSKGWKLAKGGANKPDTFNELPEAEF